MRGRDIAYRNFTKCLHLDIVNLREGMQLFFQGLERTIIAAGQKVVLKGDVAKGVYLVARGTLRLTASGQPAKLHEAGDFFRGASAPDQLAIETETEVVLYALSPADFARVLEKAPQIIRVFEETDQNEPEPEALPQNGRVNMLKIEPDLRIADQSPRKLRDYIAFPYIKQHDETDCGAACLGMICQYYGQSIGLNRLRDMANVSREGTSLSALAEAAENLGFLARGVRVGYEELGDRDLPLIAHWEGYHFVVLFRVNSKYAWIADPALGRRKISRKEFEEKWSNLALMLDYTEKVSRSRQRRSTFRRFFPFARPYFGILAEIMIASLVLSLFGLASPLFTQMILDQVLVHQDTRLLNLLLMGMIMIALFRIATSALRNYLIGYVGARISISMLSHIYHHLLTRRVLPPDIASLLFAADVGEVIGPIKISSHYEREEKGYALYYVQRHCAAVLDAPTKARCVQELYQLRLGREAKRSHISYPFLNSICTKHPLPQENLMAQR